nr:MAG TPA: hypothetical protein [Caudoviricetes sp.]
MRVGADTKALDELKCLLSNNRAISKQFTLVDLTGGRRGIYNAASMNMVAGYNKKGTLFCRENSAYRDFLCSKGAAVHPHISRLIRANSLSGYADRNYVDKANYNYYSDKIKEFAKDKPFGVYEVCTTRWIIDTTRWHLKVDGKYIGIRSFKRGDGGVICISINDTPMPDVDVFKLASSGGRFSSYVAGAESWIKVTNDNQYAVVQAEKVDISSPGFVYYKDGYAIRPMFLVNNEWKLVEELSMLELRACTATHGGPRELLLALEEFKK